MCMCICPCVCVIYGQLYSTVLKFRQELDTVLEIPAPHLNKLNVEALALKSCSPLIPRCRLVWGRTPDPQTLN